jgi:hypothetical protein
MERKFQLSPPKEVTNKWEKNPIVLTGGKLA